MTEALREEQMKDGGRALQDSRPPQRWDEQAAVRAYLTYHKGLFRFAVSMLSGDVWAAADAVQGTFLIVLTRWDSLRDLDRIQGWMYAIIRRECLRILRSEAWTMDIDVADEIDLLPTVESAEGMALANLESSAVAAALRLLSPRQRQILTLSMAGQTTAEITDQLGIDANAVRVHLYHARRKLKALLDSGGD